MHSRASGVLARPLWAKGLRIDCRGAAGMVVRPMVLVHRLLALLALLALVGGGLHSASMANVGRSAALAKPEINQSAAMDCHGEAAKPAPANSVPVKAADCCPTGCDGNCTMIGALLSSPPIRRVVAFLRAALDAPVKAAVASGGVFALERPPKLQS